METVLPAIIVMLIMMFATLTAANSLTTAQGRIQAGQQAMQNRLTDQSRTALTPVDAQVGPDGAEIEATFRNSGTVRLTDFKHWDLIVQYYDTTHGSHALWLPYYTGVSPTVQEWSVVGLYMDAASSTVEVYEPGIFNPGEEMVIRLRLPAEVEEDVAGMATLSTSNGVSAPIFFTRPKMQQP